MYCNDQIQKEQRALNYLETRGFSRETISSTYLGWNPVNLLLNRATWGLSLEYRENGKERLLWIPRGIVIPTFVGEQVVKLKIRRKDWKEGDNLPKYVEIGGSMPSPSFWEKKHTDVIILVESELDAMLIQQYAADICACLALGGVGKKPDAITHEILSKARIILFALDYDEAGKKAYNFWKNNYCNLRAWPSPIAKSPGDALLQAVDLRNWIFQGLKKYR